MTAINSEQAKLKIAAEKYSKRTNDAIRWRFSDLNVKTKKQYILPKIKIQIATFKTDNDE